MGRFNDSLRGYSFAVHERDGWVCQYCGLVDGKRSFDEWIRLSVDHLLPKGHPDRDNREYMTTSCGFCNGAANRYFEAEARAGRKFDNLTREELIARRKPLVEKTREDYRRFWAERVSGGRTKPT